MTLLRNLPLAPGGLRIPDPELARRALDALKAREGEDIEEWARKLAEEVADAND